MNKYYIPHKLKIGQFTNLSDKDSSDIILTGDLKVEDIIIIENPYMQFQAEVIDIAQSVSVQIISIIKEMTSEARYVNLFINVTEDIDRFKFLVEKATELQASSITPIICEHSKVSLKRSRKLTNLFNAHIKRASTQSRNNFPPVLNKSEKLQDINVTNPIVLSSENSGQKISFAELDFGPKEFNIFIGPERGFSGQEIQDFEARGARFISLGEKIMRVETAGIFITALINYNKGIYEKRT